jgi:hypothetical protein
MADHLHKQIRAAVATLLGGLTTTSTRVYPNRLQPMADANLPGLRIFMDQEDVSIVTVHAPQMQERNLGIIVECCAKSSTGLDDALDQISKEVEIAMAAGITLSSKLLPIVYTGMQFDDDFSSDKPVGVKRLKFFIDYTAMSNAPDVLN